MSTQPSLRETDGAWPELPFTEWADTLATLHMYFQIVGKIRMELTPWINHAWSTTLYVSPRGLTTSTMPRGGQDFQIDFDFIDHQISLSASDGKKWSMPLEPRTVAEFYAKLFAGLADNGCHVDIYATPNEIPAPIPFAEDTTHSAYVPEHAFSLWDVLRNSARVMSDFRAAFRGKVSPVHFFWGAPDLAVTRFSGRKAPEHPGGVPNLPDEITREAYSHEVASCGFWPGNKDVPEPIFYAYAYPTPDGFAEAKVEPAGAQWNKDLGEFVLPYTAVQKADSPDETLYSFLQSAYAAAADLANWDRTALELPRNFRPLARAVQR